MKTFIQIYKEKLNEGGNVELKTGEKATRIDLTKYNRKEIAKEIEKSLRAFNNEYKKQMKEYLWASFDKIFKDRSLFSGSSRPFFDQNIKDTEFVEYKNLVGDMDLQFNKAKNKDLKIFLMKNIGKKFGNMKYLGEGGTSFTQYNTLFQYKDLTIQIDFEPVLWTAQEDAPDEFSIFAHYSSWTDIKAGVKGVFHKFLLRSLVSNGSKMGMITVITKTGKISKSAKFDKNVSMKGFSVDKGIRAKFEPILDEKGNILITNGKPTYTELPSKGAKYETNLINIYALIFEKEPNKQEIKKFHSFVGILEDLRMLQKKDVENVFDSFLNILFGKGAQKLIKGKEGAEEDKNTKMASVNKFVEKYGGLESILKKWQPVIKTYYEDYK